MNATQFSSHFDNVLAEHKKESMGSSTGCQYFTQLSSPYGLHWDLATIRRKYCGKWLCGDALAEESRMFAVFLYFYLISIDLAVAGMYGDLFGSKLLGNGAALALVLGFIASFVFLLFLLVTGDSLVRHCIKIWRFTFAKKKLKNALIEIRAEVIRELKSQKRLR